MPVLLIFLDGVGLGRDDPSVNPLVSARMPTLRELLDGRALVGGNGAVVARQASLVPTDARLGVTGLPQSGTGQTAIFTGVNAPQYIGQHYGPYPNPPLKTVIAEHSLFGQVRVAGGQVAFANAYPDRYLDRLRRGTGRCSVTSLAAQRGGARLRSHTDLARFRAISAYLTNEGWRERLGHSDVPDVTERQAGANLARLAADHDFTVFEYFATDVAGHRGSHVEAVTVLEKLDAFLAGVLDTFDLDHSLLLITSDHGNLEDLTTVKHTLNPVPTLIVGRDHARLAKRISDLTDIAPTVMDWLVREAGGV
jgi:2,3-bisphosphoglycerate-independent phosphoglycerate mutase